jgi:Holliday junction resolvase RusA-like endonuclease
MIEIKPISVNACWQGRRFATKAFKRWQGLVVNQMRWQAKESECPLPFEWEKIHLHLRLYLEHPLKSDTDNYQKPIIDCIVKSGWIKDDRYIFRITTEKIKSDKEGFDFSIKELKINDDV